MGATIVDQSKDRMSPTNGKTRKTVLKGAVRHIPVKMNNDSSPITN